MRPAQGYGAQAENMVHGQRKQRSKFRPINIAGFRGQGALKEGAAGKEHSKIAQVLVKICMSRAGLQET